MEYNYNVPTLSLSEAVAKAESIVKTYQASETFTTDEVLAVGASFAYIRACIDGVCGVDTQSSALAGLILGALKSKGLNKPAAEIRFDDIFSFAIKSVLGTDTNMQIVSNDVIISINVGEKNSEVVNSTYIRTQAGYTTDNLSSLKEGIIGNKDWLGYFKTPTVPIDNNKITTDVHSGVLDGQAITVKADKVVSVSISITKSK